MRSRVDFRLRVPQKLAESRGPGPVGRGVVATRTRAVMYKSDNGLGAVVHDGCACMRQGEHAMAIRGHGVAYSMGHAHMGHIAQLPSASGCARRPERALKSIANRTATHGRCINHPPTIHGPPSEWPDHSQP
jgi:hypothetical protein